MLKILLSYFFGFFIIINGYSQPTFNYYISNVGNDTNAGTSKLLPKQTLNGAMPALNNHARSHGSVAVGLKGGSFFNERLVPSYTVHAGAYSYASGAPDFAILNGSDVFNTGWSLLASGNFTYTQMISRTGFNANDVMGTGSIIYVIEIDTALEKVRPFSARKLLKLVVDKSAVETTPGSFFITKTSDNPLPVFIHTSDGSSPNSHSRYRYEVTVRDQGINAYRYNDNKFENLWVRGYGTSYGLLPSGSNSLYKSVIFGPGAPGHHVVTKNGTFNNCLFLPGLDNASVFAIVFYDVQGYQRRNKVSNTLFLDIPTPIYAHNSNGSNYNKMELENTIAFGDSNIAYVFAGAANTDTITFKNISTYGYYSSYGNGSAKIVHIKDSYFHYAGDGISFGSNQVTAVVDNVFINGKDRSRCIKMDINTNLTLTNSILQVTAPNTSAAFVARSGEVNNRITAQKNIFVCKVNSNQYVTSALTNTNNGIATSGDFWDYNVYIQVSGKIQWGITNRATTSQVTNISTFKEWQRQSGQDKNSLFFDLSNDYRGLQAIFIDPDNGNYELANTVEGNKVRALGAGMTTPLACYLKKPTYEEAAEMIRNEKIPTVNSCRNPCQQTRAKVSFSITADANGVINICQNKPLTIKGRADFLENDISYHQAGDRQRYLWWSSDGQDTMGTNLNAVTQTFRQPGTTHIRLQMVDENGCSYDTTVTINVIAEAIKPDLGKDTSLCTGQILPLTVRNKTTNDLYTWSTGATGTGDIDVREAGKYWVKNDDYRGCPNYDTIMVVNKTPIAVSLGRDTVFCASVNTKTIAAVATGSIKSFEWNTGAASKQIQIARSGTYIVTARDFGVCVVSDTIVVTDNPVNTFSLPADTSVCTGTGYLLSLKPAPATLITWNDGMTAFSRVVKSGIYSITAVNDGCIRKDTLVILTKPFPVVKLPSDTIICNGYNFPLSVSYPGASYLWSTGSNENAIRVTKKGIYWVEVTAAGCSFKDSLTLNVQKCDCNFKMPNAFSPNGDGVNDVIMPKMDCYPTGYTLSVFNRYGQVVYTTKNFTTSWKGDLNGKPLPVGTYYYIVNIKNEGVTTAPIKGSITLLR